VLAVGEEERGGAIHLLDFASGQELLSLEGHHSGVITMLFKSDGRALFSGGGDSTILRWDATGRRSARRALHVVAALPRAVAQPYVRELVRGDRGAVLTEEAKALLRRWQDREKTAGTPGER
jgi:WD40 repeat protein